MISLLDKAGIGRGEAARILDSALKGADDGELFVEQRLSEQAVFDDGRLKSASFDEAQGFGLRVVSGETQGYSHSTELSATAMKRAADICRTIIGGPASAIAAAPARTNRELYPAQNPSDHFAFADKVALLQRVDDFARKADPRIKQVSVSLSGDWQEIEILRAGGEVYRDSRPLVRFQVSVMASDGTERASGSYGFGGRGLYSDYVSEAAWQDAVREAVRQSLVGLEAKPAPAGEMDVVLGPGWPGILLHEAIGHGLEGDFNRKKTSAFAGLMGERIAARGITVVDDGTVARARGSIAIDDEGTPSSTTTLIEDGILVGYMQDRLNARLMGMKPTGNGRRQSYAHSPMPRMTNTYMLNGDKHPDEILASVKNGLFAKSFGGGQVDITSGKFVFSCTEAYLIENGRLTMPVKGATIIGNGADALKRISMVGNDMALDPGIGTCGKQGQGVPVCVGQPSLRLDQITVGGTAA
ncbi:MAG: metalloprotease TldD [Pseudomonadota bacterium]